MLETERLRLRLPAAADVESPPAFLGDPEVMGFLGGIDDPHAVVRRWLDDWETYPAGKFVVETLAGEIVGRVGLNFYDARTWHRSAAADAQPELTWALARTHWGHGYATEAAAAVRDWFPAPRLVSLIERRNDRSARVAERLGARPTETVPFSDGTPVVIWVHP